MIADASSTARPGELMLGVCLKCESVIRGGTLGCQRRDMLVRIVLLAAAGQRFCPDGKHDHIVAETRRVPRSGLARLRFYAAAATKLTLALLRLCRAPAATLAARRKTCRGCEKLEQKRLLGLVEVDVCGICRCWMSAKTALATEHCPRQWAKAWRAVDGERRGLVRRLPLVGRVLRPIAGGAGRSGDCGCGAGNGEAARPSGTAEKGDGDAR